MRPASSVSLLLIAFVLAGCGSSPAPRPVATSSAPAPTYAPPPPPPRPAPPPPPASEQVEPPPSPVFASKNGYTEVRVFFATDRKAEAESGVFSGGRGSGLSYGSMFISVPREHAVGEIERPSIWRLEFSEDPQKHMVILRRAVGSRDEFFNSLRVKLAHGDSEASFLFVHGYNVAFDDAARRTAQIAYDLDFRGAPVFYSWPSQGSLQGYLTDENNVQWSEANLKAFLLDYAQNSGAKDIYLIAHSMGNRALTGAVRQLFAEHPELRGVSRRSS